MGKIVTTGKGRRWLANGHPWLFADDVASGKGEPGELVPVEEAFAWLRRAGYEVEEGVVRGAGA